MLGRKVKVTGYKTSGTVIGVWKTNYGIKLVVAHDKLGFNSNVDLVGLLLENPSVNIELVKDSDKFNHSPKLVHMVESVVYIDKFVPNTNLFRKLYPNYIEINSNIIRVEV